MPVGSTAFGEHKVQSASLWTGTSFSNLSSTPIPAETEPQLQGGFLPLLLINFHSMTLDRKQGSDIFTVLSFLISVFCIPFECIHIYIYSNRNIWYCMLCYMLYVKSKCNFQIKAAVFMKIKINWVINIQHNF